jgi:transposase-like protein
MGTRTGTAAGAHGRLAGLRAGEVLEVAGLEELGRTPREVIAVVGEIQRRGGGLRSLREGVDTTGPGGEAVFRVLAGLDALGRAAISAGTSEGLAAARARGQRLGRPPALTAEQLGEVRALLARPESTVAGVARQLGVSRSTLYKYLPDTRRASSPSGTSEVTGVGGPAGVGGPDAEAEVRRAAEGERAGAHLAPYLARPGRRALVIDDLAGLRGPVTGRVELPLRLFWSPPGHQFDLTDRDMRLWYYQTVLREATRADDLAGFLDAATLERLWPELYLPAGVRRAWEERHPSLRPGARTGRAQTCKARG